MKMFDRRHISPHDIAWRTLMFAVGLGLTVSSPMGSALAGNEAARISVDAIGHWHVYDHKTLSFSITDLDRGSRAKLSIAVEIAHGHSDRMTRLTDRDGTVINKGNGKYTFSYTPTSIGSYALVVKATVGDRLAVSSPVAIDVVRAGDEGIKVAAQDTEFVYQIRYDWNPGQIRADPTKPAKLVFELMRGIERGAEIVWDKPWKNRFDHVAGATDVTAALISKDGAVSETLQFSYKGKGIYEASRVFKPAEVGPAKDYTVQLSFVDPVNNAKVKSPRAYNLRAVQPQ